VDWATPESDLEEALRALDLRGESDLLLVTHQPFVGNLAGWLVNGSHSEPLPMATRRSPNSKGKPSRAG